MSHPINLLVKRIWRNIDASCSISRRLGAVYRRGFIKMISVHAVDFIVKLLDILCVVECPLALSNNFFKGFVYIVVILKTTALVFSR